MRCPQGGRPPSLPLFTHPRNGRFLRLGLEIGGEGGFGWTATRCSRGGGDLLADSGGGLEVGDEVDELRLYDVGVGERLVQVCSARRVEQ
jgi:hypothetical protein